MEKNAEKPKTWKELKTSKKTESAGVSWRARFRSIFRILKRLTILAFVILICFGAWKLYDSGEIEKLLSPSTENLKKIEYKTDGVISKTWIAQHRLFPPVQNLANVDILNLKTRFEKVSQIKSANVQKIYPDKIRIELSEYKPCARVAVAQNKKIYEYALSKDGAIFEPICTPRETLIDLPWVIGVPIVRNDKLFEPYDYAIKIDELIKKAKLALPEHFKTWRTINAENLGDVALPLMLVTNSDKIKIIFHANNIDFQLKKLEYILSYYEENGLENIEKIDLSFDSRAIVTTRKESKESK